MPDPADLITVQPSTRWWPLHDVARSRAIEADALRNTGAHVLIERAGLAVARLALALAPHAARTWVLAGPGNNGGDGLVAARHLHLAGRHVQVNLLASTASMPPDAAHALQQAREAGVRIADGLDGAEPGDLTLDALLGIGAARAPDGLFAEAIRLANARARGQLLAIDIPSGLSADTGSLLGHDAVIADHTLTLLTIKPGLFTHSGRDHAGHVWFDRLGVDIDSARSTGWLTGPPVPDRRAHAQHKGSFGDAMIIGGAVGMGGAAMLAARAALTAGAGRVYIGRLDQCTDVDPHRPELMPRAIEALLQPTSLTAATVVCGCGGGQAVREVLPKVLHHAARLVLDADALNALAEDSSLRTLLVKRRSRGLSTILTPHPLEAARLMDRSTRELQADRLSSAAELAGKLNCTVLLKGSGTVITSPEAPPWINSTGNARLATAGTGDVLAGWIGGRWSAQPLASPATLAAEAAWRQGWAAEAAPGPLHLPLRAADLIDAMAAAAPDAVSDAPAGPLSPVSPS